MDCNGIDEACRGIHFLVSLIIKEIWIRHWPDQAPFISIKAKAYNTAPYLEP